MKNQKKTSTKASSKAAKPRIILRDLKPSKDAKAGAMIKESYYK